MQSQSFHLKIGDGRRIVLPPDYATACIWASAIRRSLPWKTTM